MNKKPEHRTSDMHLLEDEVEHPGNIHNENENEVNENESNKIQLSEKQEYLEKKNER